VRRPSLGNNIFKRNYIWPNKEGTAEKGRKKEERGDRKRKKKRTWSKSFPRKKK